MSQATAGGAITERTSTKTTVYSGYRMLNAFMETCEAALAYSDQSVDLCMLCNAALDGDAASHAMPVAVPSLMRDYMQGSAYSGRRVI